jgi:hypothetical protein
VLGVEHGEAQAVAAADQLTHFSHIFGLGFEVYRLSIYEAEVFPVHGFVRHGMILAERGGGTEWTLTFRGESRSVQAAAL